MPSLNFVIAGTGPQLESLKKLKDNLFLKNVDFKGFVPDSKMRQVYNSFDLFIFPSLYEGFGLPPLEAMACGVPCLISNLGSLPEIGGKSSVIIDINNLPQSAEIIKNLIKNKAKLATLSKKSIIRSKKFTWKFCAEKTLEVYNTYK